MLHCDSILTHETNNEMIKPSSSLQKPANPYEWSVVHEHLVPLMTCGLFTPGGESGPQSSFRVHAHYWTSTMHHRVWCSNMPREDFLILEKLGEEDKVFRIRQYRLQKVGKRAHLESPRAGIWTPVLLILNCKFLPPHSWWPLEGVSEVEMYPVILPVYLCTESLLLGVLLGILFNNSYYKGRNSLIFCERTHVANSYKASLLKNEILTGHSRSCL